MSNSEQSSRGTGMTVTVLGHEVSMQFAEKPNPAVALHVKKALLGLYLPVKR